MNNKIKIPKKFKLLGQTINVKFDNSLMFENNWLVVADYRKRIIGLQPDGKQNKIYNENLEHTYLHELTHWILHTMNEHELNQNEKFVDVFSGLLHQALKTSEY